MTCLWCRAAFEPGRSDNVYCSKNCRQKRHRFFAKYRIGRAQLDEMLAAQGNACALCRRVFELTSPIVDHCHETGRVRGLLCIPCNQALGALGDNEEGLLRALEYVRTPSEEPA